MAFVSGLLFGAILVAIIMKISSKVSLADNANIAETNPTPRELQPDTSVIKAEDQKKSALKASAGSTDSKAPGWDRSSSSFRVESPGTTYRSVNSRPRNKATVSKFFDDFVAIDVETAQGKRYSICQIGLVKVQGDRIVEEFTALVQPPDNKYSPFNIRVHGIGSLMTENKPLFPDVWGKVLPIIQDIPIVAHNASFDIGSITAALEYYGMAVPDFRYDCTLKLTKLSLDKACQAHEIILNNHHDAISDARACAELYLALKKGRCPDLSLIKEKKSLRNQPAIDKEQLNTNHPLFEQDIVFTGELASMTRSFAAQLAQSCGANVKSSITRNTDYVVMGKNPGSTKVSMIMKLQDVGHPLKVINEVEFQELASQGE